MKKLLFLCLILGLNPLFCMESKPVKTSLWERTKSFMARTVEKVKRRALAPTGLEKSPTYRAIVYRDKHLTKPSAHLTEMPYLEDGPHFEYEPTKCSHQAIHYTGELNQIPYLEDFPSFEKGELHCSHKLLTEFLKREMFELRRWERFLIFPYLADRAANLIFQIIKNELAHPDHQSFFHTASQKNALLFTLHKKLYEKFGGKTSQNFVFFRAPKTREHLREITREDYIDRNPHIDDDRDQYKNDFLSASRLPWHDALYLYLWSRSYSTEVPVQKLIATALKAYELPCPTIAPFDLPSETEWGVFVHILLKNKLADKLSYEADGDIKGAFGIPVFTKDKTLLSAQETYEKAVRSISTYNAEDEDEEEILPSTLETRVIVAPPYFDEPNQEVIMYCSEDEKIKKIKDKYCEKIIEDAQKLKFERETKK
ncbi:TPA: hypothetical protein DIC20_02185 [Candidatus Dependentiae bacterium]|nr:MAG: hypothetical protein US03_C0006G0004 [candidate division TM6 bacterium GW2011_GWF2_36_131]KKQ03048.1 MAG: hypothetical protein US13_C0006G0004 [candidate division TM6 bacterium GW2011_GWE2_36_25]KKQ19615.1 MAG: hypothetical protein US32_C0007G0068 [candidate division TM6 bacterium GW2011_GWA2_36_9]HBR71130.1 hypothetical protein [Candidatus Dependentiae bacterium]HCU00493.1 hypothetical protein [Candidatus Dependentiae bacterium]